jgi:hypothetical protein
VITHPEDQEQRPELRCLCNSAGGCLRPEYLLGIIVRRGFRPWCVDAALVGAGGGIVHEIFGPCTAPPPVGGTNEEVVRALSAQNSRFPVLPSSFLPHRSQPAASANVDLKLGLRKIVVVYRTLWL